MTPAEKIGHKIRDRFVVSGSVAFTDGSIIELEYDDGSKSPLFKLINGGCKYNNARNELAGAYCSLDFVKIKENKMTSHKHAEMIKAKADNMELVVFEKDPSGWLMRISDIIHMNPSKEYFLCLPKHNENGQCLHWLNGGEIEFNSELSDGWEEYEPIRYWGLGSVFMQDDYQLRIKPKKEKLWLAVKTDKHETLGGCRKVRICSHAFVNKQDAEDYLDLRDSQLIEIEVEV